jgi:hypothetical protein
MNRVWLLRQKKIIRVKGDGLKMATKKDYIKELIELGVAESEAELNKKTNKQLEKMIASFNDEETSEEASQPSQAEQMMLQMQQQMAEMMEQMNVLQQKNQQLEAEKVAGNKENKVGSIKEAPMKITQIDKDRLIPVMNITAHSLVYVSKRTGAEWNWSHYGDIEYMEVQELLTMRNAHRRFLDVPFILIMDDDAVSYLGLEKMYKDMIEPDNIDKVFKMRIDDFKEVVEKSPKGIQILIANRAKQLIDKGELDSMAKITFINEKFNTDLGIK